MPKTFKCDVKIEADLEVTKTLIIQTPTSDSHAATKKYVDDIVASDIATSTTNFNGNLSSSDNTIQKALDTLDNLSVGGGLSAVVIDSDDSPYAASAGSVILVTTSSGTVEIDFPSAASNSGKTIIVINASGQLVNCDPYSGEYINQYSDSDPFSIYSSYRYEMVAVNSKWWVL